MGGVRILLEWLEMQSFKEVQAKTQRALTGSMRH